MVYVTITQLCHYSTGQRPEAYRSRDSLWVTELVSSRTRP